jgi:hypothetical protein
LIAINGSPSDVSDKIKEILYTKSAEKVDLVRPEIANMMFGSTEESGDE